MADSSRRARLLGAPSTSTTRVEKSLRWCSQCEAAMVLILRFGAYAALRQSLSVALRLTAHPTLPMKLDASKALPTPNATIASAPWKPAANLRAQHRAPPFPYPLSGGPNAAALIARRPLGAAQPVPAPIRSE